MNAAKFEALEKLNKVLQSKIAKQRNEIGRLNHALDKATKEKLELVKEVKALRAEVSK